MDVKCLLAQVFHLLMEDGSMSLQLNPLMQNMLEITHVKPGIRRAYLITPLILL